MSEQLPQQIERHETRATHHLVEHMMTYIQQLDAALVMLLVLMGVNTLLLIFVAYKVA